MAVHETLHDYYMHQHSHLEYYVKCCENSTDPETVHELRLSIKKLRALNILAGQFAENYRDKPFRLKRRIRRVYQLAGELRDTQVQAEMHSAFEKLTGSEYPEYRSWLQQRELKKRTLFYKTVHHASSSATMQTGQKQVSRILANAESKSILQNSRKIIADLYKKAEQLTSGTINERSLHSVRKVSKQLRYIISIIQHSYPEFRFKKISVETLRVIEEEAGHWHDCLVRVEFLIKYTGKLSLRNHSAAARYQKLLGIYNSEHEEAFARVLIVARNAYNRQNPKSKRSE